MRTKFKTNSRIEKVLSKLLTWPPTQNEIEDDIALCVHVLREFDIDLSLEEAEAVRLAYLGYKR